MAKSNSDGLGRSGLSKLLGRFGHKIKTSAELATALGPRPRAQAVIMCHGVFDVVHPGHLRHLLYAKSRADILVASITADVHIAKADFRPHVPEGLRALNLAALEMVDYVLIDPNPTPLETLAHLQPDYFAKGFAYSSEGLPPKTQEEKDLVESYGGEMVFTPGDIVYSSSKFITDAPPNLKIDKLISLMDASNISFEDLHAALGKLSGIKVHVVGDTIVDSLTRTSTIGGQGKTPTMSVLYEGRSDYVGGAGIVANHLRAAGADVVFSTVLGDDALGKFVIKQLNDAGVDIRAIVDKRRPTTNKNAIIAGGYRLLKIDTLDNSSISERIVKQLSDALKSTPSRAVIFSDFRHGIFNRQTIPILTAAIPDGKFKAADSQVASRWGNITEFKGFDLITPNEREARFALGDQDSIIRPLASRLYDESAAKLLILKLGERGVLTVRDPQHDRSSSFFVVDSFVDHVIDAVGAGDALLAYAVLGKLATGSEVIATILGSMAAACECERDGNIPIAPKDVAAKLTQIERQLTNGEA
jgi:bifunctional ADP-heptose synthase (sugar kinase/adenylyltransferase)